MQKHKNDSIWKQGFGLTSTINQWFIHIQHSVIWLSHSEQHVSTRVCTCAVRRFWGSGLCKLGLTGSFPRPEELWMGGGWTEDEELWTTGTWEKTPNYIKGALQQLKYVIFHKQDWLYISEWQAKFLFEKFLITFWLV